MIKINVEFEAYREQIEQCLRDFDSAGQTLFKGRNTVKAFQLVDGPLVVVKRFAQLIWLRRLIYSAICRSKARRAYEYGMRFLNLGFDTPTPVAYCEISNGGLLCESYFVSLHTDAKPLYPILVDNPRFDTHLADCVAQLMVRLHESGAIHGDPNLNNILFSYNENGGVELTLIDTNRSSFSHRLSKHRCLKNLMRVTHRRDLMRQIAGRYAELRGFDPVSTVNHEFALLEKFERNRSVRHKLKALLKK